MGVKQLKEIKRMRELTVFSVIIMMLIFLSITSTIRDVLGFASNMIVVPDDYPSIQSAINNAKPGYTIMVKSGIYHENIIVNKEIALEGIDSGRGRPLINGEVLIEADNVKFKGFTVMHGDKGILINGSRRCVVTDNFIAYNRFGIYLNMSSNCLIANNTLYQNSWAGIFIEQSSGNIIMNNNVSYGFNGIYIKSSNMTKISGNLIENIVFNGIMLDSIEYGPAHNNTIVNNVLRKTKMLLATIEPSYSEITNNIFVNGGIEIWYLSFKHFNNIVRNNTVNGKPLILLNNAAGIKIDYAGQVILINCMNITVENLNISHTAVAIQLLNTSNTRLENNVLSNSGVGIELDSSSNNIIRNNTVSNNYDYGICLAWDSNNNVVADNKINGTSKYGGLYLHFSNNNELRSNIIVNNDIGILHTYSSHNTIYKNYVAYNKLGIELFASSWNTIYRNMFLENDIGVNITDAGSVNDIFYLSVNNIFYLNDFMNKVNAYSSSRETNLWFSKQKITYSYNGRIYTSPLGNYWSDYVGTDMNEDGVGDNPYDKGNVIDPYPLSSHVSNYSISPPITVVVEGLPQSYRIPVYVNGVFSGYVQGGGSMTLNVSEVKVTIRVGQPAVGANDTVYEAVNDTLTVSPGGKAVFRYTAAKFYVKVLSGLAPAFGSGWYRKGDEARVGLEGLKDGYYYSPDGKARYRFEGWEVKKGNFSAPAAPGFSLSVSGPVVLEARFGPPEYKVCIDSACSYYREGYTIPPGQDVPELGGLLIRRFEGYVDASGKSLGESFTVNGPISATSAYRVEVNLPLLAAVLAVLALLAALSVLRVRVKPRKRGKGVGEEG